MAVEDLNGNGRLEIEAEGALLNLTEDGEWVLHGGMICHVPASRPFITHAYPFAQRPSGSAK